MSQTRPTDHEATVYAENWIIYGDRTKAWRQVFPDSKGGMENANNRASKFHALSEVQARIVELQKIAKKVAEDDFKLTTTDIHKTLATAIKKGLKDKTDAQGNSVAHNLGAAVSAAAEINKMCGNHAPAKQDHMSSDGSMTPKPTISREEAMELLHSDKLAP